MAGGIKHKKNGGSVKNTPPIPPTPPQTKEAAADLFAAPNPPTLAQLQQEAALLKNKIKKLQNDLQSETDQTKQLQLSSEIFQLDAQKKQVAKAINQMQKQATQASSSSSKDASSSSSSSSSSTGSDPSVNVAKIIHSYMKDQLKMVDSNSEEYKEIFENLRELLTGSGETAKAFADNDATCGTSGQPVDNNALFQDFQQFVEAHKGWKHGNAGKIDAMIKEAMAHYTSPQTFAKFDKAYKEWTGTQQAGGSETPKKANEGDPAPTPEGESELDKERQNIEKSGNAAIGSTAQQQLADQIQQDLVGILPEGSTLKEGENPVKDGGKSYQKGQTDPNSVPTGVAAATNPFIGKASTSGSYGQLNYAQVSGTPQKKEEKDEKGNIIRTLYNDTMEGRQGQTFTYPTVRPEYMILGENDLAMSAYEQLRGDIEFDLFSVVKEGHGLGATNSLYLDNKRNEWAVRFKPKLFEPRAWLGHELGVVPPRKEVQAVMSPETIAAGPKRAKRLLNDEMNYVRTLPGAASAGFLPDDNNRMQSSTGLGTTKPSPFLPHIDTHYYWQRQFDPAGVHMQSRKFRKLYDPLRQPQKNSPAQSGRARPQRTRRHPITYDIY